MKILLVEDNKGEQLILQEAFQEAKVNCDLSIVDDGIQAMDFLNRKGEFKDAPRPDFVILDLNLPKMNGREVLSQIRKSPQLKHIPVLILSNSSSQKDVCECYELKASAYVGKPSGYQGFVDFAHTVKVFWVGLVCYCSHA